MDALIFDFDGVLVDSEPIHLQAFMETLRPMGVELTRQEYFEKYLGFDDYTCLAEALRYHGLPVDTEQIEDMVVRKTRILQEHLATSIPPIAGAVELVRAAAGEGVPLAICSGALREEIRIGLEVIGAAAWFPVVVAAEDVHRTKPHPEGYSRAATLLGERIDRGVAPEKCVAMEDSPTGIASAQAAGMKVLAVHTSYPPEALHQADRVEPDFRSVTLASLRAMTE